MRLLYTDVANDLTKLLAQEAQAYADAGKRVFYIAPNSLSFDKERKVLESLPKKASFAITVTRFGQMARYLTLSQHHHRPTIDDQGLALVVYRVLSTLDEGDLKSYGLLRTDPAFVLQLVDFYKEWQSTGLDDEVLGEFETDKLADIRLIFNRMNAVMADLTYATTSNIGQLRQDLATGQLRQSLSQVVVIVDGFTRFTAEEEGLLEQLHTSCHEVVIGAYASQTAYKASYQAGQLYEASVTFLRHLAETFETKPSYISANPPETGFSRLTQVLENRYAYRESDLTLTEADQSVVQLWQTSGIKEELEEVAQAIRQKIAQGYRYKDMLVLLGDVASYGLQLGQVFETYAIPFYLGKAESMSDHPLVQVMDSLERLLRYNWRAEDLLNLLQSGLIGQFDQSAVDKFDQYVTYANLKGRRAFGRPFTKTNGQFDLEALNVTRETLVLPLLTFFDQPSSSTQGLLTGLLGLLEGFSLRANLTQLASQGSQLEADKHEQVWKTFCGLLTQIGQIFEQTPLSLPEFLSLLRSGMLVASYRVVPATVDVVTVSSYNLIEPHSKPFVFAIGLTQSNFPEIVKNVSLLSDEERLTINDQLTSGQLDLPSRDNLKRNNYTFVSLLNSARKELVLSSPTRLGESEDTLSTYLHQLERLGLPLVTKTRDSLAPGDIATYRSLLGRLVEAYQADIKLDELDKDRADYWSVLIRRLQRHMAEQGLSLPEVKAVPISSPLSPETLAVRYPVERPLRLSASSLSHFYNNAYSFFLTNVLGLKEEQSILPDARHHGIFFHRVFELVTADRTETPFDAKLDRALQTASQEPDLATIYQQSAQTRFAQEVMTNMIRATAQVLADETQIEVVAQEASFGFKAPYVLDLPSGRQLAISGKIDRLDKLAETASYGVVDYKSGDKRFKLSDFYNGLAPQLLTYLGALKHASEFEQVADIFGAMYLQVHQPIVNLAKTATADDLLASAQQSLTYKGLFLAEQAPALDARYSSKTNTYSQEELDLLLAYNDHLYRQAGQAILAGQFAINPYTPDGKTVSGDQLKAITRFEADHHMPQARRLTQFPTKDQRGLVLGAMAEQLGQQKEDDHV